MSSVINYQKYVRVALLASVVIAFIWFFIKDFNPSGKLSIKYNFCKPSPYISALSPMGRVLDPVRVKVPNSFQNRVKKWILFVNESSNLNSNGASIEHREGYCAQKMVIDPVYVDVRLPQRYDTATMVIVYKKSDELPFQAGPWASATEWQWALQSLETIEESDEGWQTAVAHFDIRERPMDRRRLRFMLSSPGLAERGEVIILKEVRFEFEKPFMSKGMVKRWTASFI